MHHAAAQGHVDMMKMLLDNGADIDSRNKNLETPLLTAARKVGTGAEAGRQARGLGAAWFESVCGV